MGRRESGKKEDRRVGRRKRERMGDAQSPIPFFQFTLSKFLFGPSSRGQFHPARACSQARQYDQSLFVIFILQKTLKRNPSVDTGLGPTSPTDEPGAEWANIKLRKLSHNVESCRGTTGGAENNNNELKKVTLRKPRSHSAGDILDDRPKDEATAELKRILQRQKAAAEKGEWCLFWFVSCTFLV